MDIGSKLLIENDEFPLRYFYCTLNGNEFILTGDKEGLIYDTSIKTNIGNILIEILEYENTFRTLLEEYEGKIENEENISEDIIILYLQDLEQKLHKDCKYFNFIDFSMDITGKYIKLYNELNIKRQKNINELKKLRELKKLTDTSITQSEEWIKFITKDIKEQKSKIKKLQNIDFRSFVINQLDLYIEDFSTTLLNILFYCQKEDVCISLGKDTFSTDKEFIAYNYNLICENRKFTSYIKGICELDNKIISDEALKNITDKNISFVHIYQFNNIIELLNLAFISIIDKNININICKNCQKLFITKKRTDEVYCNRTSPQNPNKTCKEYGAKKTYRDEIKSIPIKNEHNKTSQFYRMRINRAKEQKEKEKYEKDFNIYKENYQKKKTQYKSNKLKESDFVEWIIKQKNIK